jgi:transcriptional regulator of aromatic amino acid metabolism
MSNNSFNKKLADILGKMDDKVLQAKMNAALDMLKRGDTEDLAKKISKMDKEDLLKKINEFDASKLEELNIDKNEIRQRVSEADLNNLSKLIGEHGDEIVKKFKDIIG